MFKRKEKQKKQNWLKSAVVYQIYPRSFKDSNGDGVGDLEGIIEKLDYLNDGTKESLGITAIWINPIYVSPMYDLGYDVSDHCGIDPLFGNLKTFDQLISEAHKRGIKIIMDFVPNHTSSEHPWFIESRSSRDNPKRDWYIWKNPKPDGSAPNNWVSKFGGSAWEFDEKTEQYYLHEFLPEQPELNWRNKEVRDAMSNVLRFWLDRGVDGFRTDSISYLLEDERFEDEPSNPNYIPGKDDPYESLLHVYSHGRLETVFTANIFCKVLGEYKDRIMLSESYLGIYKMMEFYKTCTNKTIIPFNFNLISLPWDAMEYKKFIDKFENELGDDYWPNYVMGNHDRSRIVSRLGKERARLVAILLLTLRGTPFIYYGEEIGMKDVQIDSEQVADTWEKRIPGLRLGRDPERTPMQWNGRLHAGFSESTPWLPVDTDSKTCNVEDEIKDPHSMLSLYRHLIHTRNNSSTLLSGSYKSIDIGVPDVFVYSREDENEQFLIVLNFGEESRVASIQGKGKGKIVCSTHLNKNGISVDLDMVPLKPHEGYVIRVER